MPNNCFKGDNYTVNVGNPNYSKRPKTKCSVWKTEQGQVQFSDSLKSKRNRSDFRQCTKLDCFGFLG